MYTRNRYTKVIADLDTRDLVNGDSRFVASLSVTIKKEKHGVKIQANKFHS